MEQMTEKELVQEFVKHAEYNFLAFAVTPWHAHGVDASIKMLREKGETLKGLIVIYPHAKSGVSVKEEHFSMRMEGNFRFVLFQFEKKYTQHKVSRQLQYLLSKEAKPSRKLYFAKAWRPNCPLSSNLYHTLGNVHITHIVFDEGLSTYMYSFKSTFQPVSLRPQDIARVCIRTGRYFKNNIIFNGILKKCKPYIPLTLFLQKKKQLVRNELAIRYYKDILLESFGQVKLDNPERFKNALLISSQPYYDAGEVFENEDLHVYKMLCDECGKRGIRVLLKPHPREKSLERLKTLGIEVIENLPISQESILAMLGDAVPAAIVGYTSTALVTAQVFFNIKAISLSSLGNKGNFAKTPLYDMKMFRKMFKNFVYLPENQGELARLLDEIETER